MSIPDFQTLMLPVLRIAAEGEVRISDVVEKLAGDFALSDDERSHLLPSGRQTTFSNRVHWAKSYLGKAGLVELTKRAHFRITEDGRTVLAAPPERIDAIVARQQVLQRLFDHRWVTLVAIDPDGRNARRYAGAHTWHPITATEDLACPQTV